MEKVVRVLLNWLIFLSSLLLLYMVSALVGSAIPVNWDQSETGDVEIFIRTNGVHTSFVFPAENHIVNWKDLVPPEYTLSKRSNFNYISFGWGDLEFYRKTPNWEDLTLPVAFRALFRETPSAVHVEYHNAMRMSEPLFPVQITGEQYRKLISFIMGSFKKDFERNLQPIEGLHYNQQDVFYLSNKNFSLFKTCNTWVNNGLKRADMKACLWTPFDEGILFQYNQF